MWYLGILHQVGLMWYLKDIATVGGQTLTLQQKRKLDEAQAIVSKTLLSTATLSAPSANAGREEMADEAVPWGHWIEAQYGSVPA